MEARGKINQYVERDDNKRTTEQFFFFTINLDTGTTPFCAGFHRESGEMKSALPIICYSNFYRLTRNAANVTHAWYRPQQQEFDRLSEEEKAHVLLGGLQLAPLKLALERHGFFSQEVDVNWSFQKWADFAERTYGIRPKNPNVEIKVGNG